MVVRIFGLFEINGLDLCGRKNLLYIMFCPFFFFFFLWRHFFFSFCAGGIFSSENWNIIAEGTLLEKKNMLYCVSFYPQVSFLSWTFLLSLTKNYKACRGGGRGMGGQPSYRERCLQKKVFSNTILGPGKKRIYIRPRKKKGYILGPRKKKGYIS